MDGIKVDIVSGEEVPEDQRNALFNQESSIDAIPDLDKLTGYIYEILEYLEMDHVKKLLKTNETAVKMHLNNKYADTVPFGIINLLMEDDQKEEHVDRLMKLFENLNNAKNGKMTLDETEKILAEDVNERYLYKKYGSKKAFEDALSKEVKREQRKKKGQLNLKDIGKVKIKN